MQSFHQEDVTDFGAIDGIATLNLRSPLTDTSAAIAHHRPPPPSHHCSACGSFIKKRSHSSSLLSPSPKKKLLFSPAVVNDGEIVKSPLSGNTLPLLHRWNSDSIIASEIYTGVGPKSPASAIASLPPLPRTLVRSVSDPPPLAAFQENSPPSQLLKSGENGPNSILKVENPKYKKMKEHLKEMIQDLEDIDNESPREIKKCEQEENADEKIIQRQEEETETVSVERLGDSLIIQLNCSCGKGSQILFSGKNCYHKLL